MKRQPVKRTFTLAAANLTGHASNVTGDSWAIATASAGDGCSHHITVRNDSVTNHSAKTILLTGLDANGQSISETISAPNTSATVTSTKAFATLLSATPSATIGADTFDIGWAATGHSPWFDLDFGMCPFCVSVAAVLVSGSCNFDLQHTYELQPNEDSPLFMQAAWTGKTASTDGSFVAPITAVRLDINSHTSGVMALSIFQAG